MLHVVEVVLCLTVDIAPYLGAIGAIVVAVARWLFE